MYELTEKLFSQWGTGYAGQVLGSPAVLVALAFAAGVYYYTSRPVCREYI
jgi:hypothetical protein